MLPLHIASIFLSAFLLFLVQPLIARMLLPWYGGSPAVWNTCLMFFQCLLLLGYAWSHWSLRLGARRQRIAQAALMFAPLILLPPALTQDLMPPPDAWPVPTLLLALALTVGPAFLALSTNASLIQRWFSLSDHPRRADPYFLYAASNLGSALGLLSYPFLVEPLLGLTDQASAWTGGYALYLLTTAAVMAKVAARPEVRAAPAARGEPLPGRRVAGWILRSAVASSLLLSASMKLSTDVAAAPLLWVVPLALYLLTFIIAFGKLTIPRSPLAALTAILVAASVSLELLTVVSPIALTGGVLLATLTVGCLLLHSDLARDRPAPEHLTAFFLYLSLGGFLGGALSNLAPLIFEDVTEYPLTLLALGLLSRSGPLPTLQDLRPFARANLLVLGAASLTAAAGLGLGLPAPSLWLFTACLALAWGAAGRAIPGLFELAMLPALGILLAEWHVRWAPLETERSFFGVSQVVEDGARRWLLHGTTAHGAAWLDPARQAEPLGYYAADGALWRLVDAQPPGARLASLGLGAGSLAAVTRPGQVFDYYEIDPVVEHMARRWFHFLDAAGAEVHVILGDARLTLAAAQVAPYDLLLLDAFTSDAIPLHLLTEEAMALYLSRLSEDGLLVAHVSNRHLDLTPVFRSHAARLGLEARACASAPDTEGALPARVIALARAQDTLRRLADDPCWRPLGEGRAVRWTDDHASLLSVLDR